MSINSIAYYSFNDTSALAVIRILGPANQSGIRVATGVENGLIHLATVSDGDIVVIQRDFCKEVYAYAEVVSLAHAQQKPVVLDIDDLLFELPEDHPDRIKGIYTDALFPLLFAIMEADLVTVSTEILRDYLLPYNPNIKVVPNYLNDSIWHLQLPAPVRDDEGPVVIGYMGGNSHQPDLVMVLPSLLKIHQKYPGKIRFHFWGITPPEEIRPYSQVDWSPPLSNDYEDFVKYFQTQTADIMIAPLCENLFNSCKSALKFLEYGAIGVAGVYSRMRPYADVITDGKEGFLASNLEEWESCLSNLIEHPQLRYQVAGNALSTIREKWLLSKNSFKLFDILSEAVFQSAGIEYSVNPLVKTGKLINRQYYEEKQNKLKQIKSLTDQSVEKDYVINSLAGQLVEKENQIVALTGQLVEKGNQIVALTGQLVEKENRIVALMGQLEGKEDQIVALAGQLVEKENQIISLAGQLNETENHLVSLANQLKANNEIIVSLTSDVEALKKEVLSYALSKSWTITRPFRKANKRFMRNKR